MLHPDSIQYLKRKLIKMHLEHFYLTAKQDKGLFKKLSINVKIGIILKQCALCHQCEFQKVCLHNIYLFIFFW